MKLLAVISAALIGGSTAFAPAPVNVQHRSSAVAPMSMAAAAIEDSFHRKLPVQRRQLADWMTKH